MPTAIEDEVDRLMREFSLLPGATVGCGYRHPAAPDPAREAGVHTLLGLYPYLRKDAGYVAFLERYAGAAAFPDPDAYHLVHIFGLLDEVYHLLESPGDPVNKEGFFEWGYTEVWEEAPHESSTVDGFSFDATGARPWGIYRSRIAPGGAAADSTWYCDTFVEWLSLALSFHRRPPG